MARDRFSKSRSIEAFTAVAGLTFASGCGGDPSGPKGLSNRDAATGLEIVDPGPRPVDCNAGKGLRLESINDFELGTDGWF